MIPFPFTVPDDVMQQLDLRITELKDDIDYHKDQLQLAETALASMLVLKASIQTPRTPVFVVPIRREAPSNG